jgi:hypothetical protein
MTGDIIQTIDADFILRMLPAWVSLGGAIVMLVLGTKHMAGGNLAKPFILIGWGALIDALTQIFGSLILIGLLPGSLPHAQFILIGGLFFRFSVVFGVVWIAHIFGVLKN